MWKIISLSYAINLDLFCIKTEFHKKLNFPRKLTLGDEISFCVNTCTVCFQIKWSLLYLTWFNVACILQLNKMILKFICFFVSFIFVENLSIVALQKQLLQACCNCNWNFCIKVFLNNCFDETIYIIKHFYVRRSKSELVKTRTSFTMRSLYW